VYEEQPQFAPVVILGIARNYDDVVLRNRYDFDLNVTPYFWTASRLCSERTNRTALMFWGLSAGPASLVAQVVSGLLGHIAAPLFVSRK
jgi:hypothetical protein